jgi:hypothetical protein
MSEPIEDQIKTLVLSAHYLGDYGRDIARAVGIPFVGVREILRAYDLEPRMRGSKGSPHMGGHKRRRNRLNIRTETKRVIDQVISLHYDGLVPAEIANEIAGEVKIQAGGVRTILKSLNIEPNARFPQMRDNHPRSRCVTDADAPAEPISEKYPIHEEMKARSGERLGVQTAIDWIMSQGYEICEDRWKDKPTVDSEYMPIRLRTDRLVAAILEIDYDAFMAEKDAMLAEIRAASEAHAGA